MQREDQMLLRLPWCLLRVLLLLCHPLFCLIKVYDG